MSILRYFAEVQTSNVQSGGTRKLTAVFKPATRIWMAVILVALMFQNVALTQESTGNRRPIIDRPLLDRPLRDRPFFNNASRNSGSESESSAVNLEESQNEPMDDNTRAWNIPLPTLGGKQFWTDHRWWNGWRVQYNSTLDHWRLISPNNIRRGWGGRQAMLDALQEVVVKGPTYQAPEHVVILAHGLFRSSASMQPIADEVNRVDEAAGQKPPRVCISFAYASTRNSIHNHSTAMREFIENLPGRPQLSFVGHSLGNIVFRHMIGDLQRNGDPSNILERLDRAVMLGPPNNGSALAASLSRLGIFETLTGSTGQHLGPAWEKIQGELGIPPCPFGIVIGDISGSPIQNPLIEGASDGVVTVAEATLDEAKEIKAFPSVHSFLMSNKDIVEAAVNFLDGGTLGNVGVDPASKLPANQTFANQDEPELERP